MCFYVHPLHPRVKIAKKDIVCYKRAHAIITVVEEKKRIRIAHVIKPPYYNFYYDFNKVYSINKKLKKFDYCGIIQIDEGFHSHVYIPTETASLVFKCVIPKGANYYFDPKSKEYVSDQIKMLCLVNLKNSKRINPQYIHPEFDTLRAGIPCGIYTYEKYFQLLAEGL